MHLKTFGSLGDRVNNTEVYMIVDNQGPQTESYSAYLFSERRIKIPPGLFTTL